MEQETNKKKILVVDDNNDLNTVLVDKFKASGFDAQGAADGEDGLKKAFQFRPDMILLDLVMPKMDGIEMLKKLRQDNWGQHVRVMVLTVIDESGHIAKVMEYSVQGYIVKTNYSLDGIVKMIKEALSAVK